MNYADTIESGIPIGFLSIVKKGFREMEFSVGEGRLRSESMILQYFCHRHASVWIGIFLGVWLWIGTHLKKTGRFKTQLELMSFHINEGKAWNEKLINLQQPKVIFTLKMSDHFSVFSDLLPT